MPTPPPSPSTTFAGAQDWTETACCLGCGYALKSLPTDRCPECGRPFQRDDPSTMRVPGWKPPKTRKPEPFGIQAIAFSAAGAVLTLIEPLEEPALYYYGFGVWLYVVIAWITRWIYYRHFATTPPPPDKPRHWRRWALPLLLLTSITIIQFDACPHARYLRLGPLEITVAGHRCSNYRHYRTVIGWLRDRASL